MGIPPAVLSSQGAHQARLLIHIVNAVLGIDKETRDVTAV